MPIVLKLKTFFKTLKAWFKTPANRRRLYIFLAILLSLFLIRSCYTAYFPKDNTFVITRDATWYPLNFMGKEKNVLGFSDDLILEIAKLKNVHVNLTRAPSGDLIEQLDNGQANGALTSLTPDVILNEQYLFSDPYYTLGSVLIVEPNSTIRSVDDLKGKYLGIMRGSPVMFYVGNYPSLKVVTYDSQTIMLEDVVRDKIDAAMLNQLTAYNMVTGYFKGRLQVVTKPLTQEGLRLMTHHGRKNQKVIDAFNEGLTELKANGTYHKLLIKWGLYDPEDNNL